ncbi:MAG: nitroreductase family protein [Acidobacteriaceae bacterium]|nr:nitroreductase family protein [Acidobacteriaceae bacterium]
MATDLETLKHAPAELGLNELLAQRWSPRSYADKLVSDSDLKTILTAAGWAASSMNEQPWRFLVGRRGHDTYDKIFDTLMPGNQAWVSTVPLLIATIARKTFTPRGDEEAKPNGWAMHDVGAASANMCLQAISLGIHTHGMAGFNREQLRANFNIPEGYEVCAVWAMGYLGSPEVLPEHYKAMETSARTRKPLSEYVFTHWEEAAKL